MINATADDIALIKNTSEGLSFVAYGFPWKAGDNVVISNEEFPSNRMVWESLADQGVEVRAVPLPCPGDVEQALIDASDNRTRLLSISSVEYASGLKIDIEKLGQLCHRKGIAFCVDAIQGLGAFPHDVKSAHIDFLSADGHKWLLGPEGIGIFYCSPEWRSKLKLTQFGWHMAEEMYEFGKTSWEPAHSARRFECGSPNMLGITALNQSLGLLLEIGMDRVWQELRERTEFLRGLIDQQPQLELISCSAEGQYAGITVFKHTQQSEEEVYKRLEANNVMCAIRGGGIRFSPHFYTPRSQLEQAVTIAAG